MKKFFVAVWNFLVDAAEYRARNIGYRGWYGWY